jgi:hypothetical protein
MRSRVLLGLLAVGCALLSGCGAATMAPVKGRVLFNGKPVPDAALTFSPLGAEGQKETGKPGTGYTDENGNFELSTFKNYDGALIGSHSVSVMVPDTHPMKCTRFKQLTLEVKPGQNEFTIEMDPK